MMQETQRTQQTAKQRQEKNMNVNAYTKTQKTHRNTQTFIKGNIGVPHWNGQ